MQNKYKNNLKNYKVLSSLYDKYYRNITTTYQAHHTKSMQGKEAGHMDIKVSRNYAAYQKEVSNAKHTEKSLSAPVQAAGKARGDAICISSEGAKKSGASSFSAALSRSMEEGAPADRIAALREQVQEGTYQVPAEQIARRLMSGL